MINNIVVNFPITVPSGNYCRHYKTKALCKYFNNEGGQNSSYRCVGVRWNGGGKKPG